MLDFATEINAGRITIPDLTTSPSKYHIPVGVVPKPVKMGIRDWRIIRHASHPHGGNSLNNAIPDSEKEVSYETINALAERIVAHSPDCWIALIDMSGYYRQFRIHPTSRPFQRYQWDGITLEDNSMMFGTACSPQQSQGVSLATCEVIEKLRFEASTDKLTVNTITPHPTATLNQTKKHSQTPAQCAVCTTTHTTTQHYSTTSLQHNNTATQHNSTTTTQQRNNTPTQQHYNTTMQHYNATTQQHYNTTTLQHNTTTPQHHNTAQNTTAHCK